MSPEECKKKIQDLNSTLWDNRVRGPRIDEWLNNFSDDLEKDYALYILSRMMYYSSLNIRSLLKSLYRDLYRYPIIREIREKNDDSIDPNIIEKQFLQELNKTRFLGVGNPSESGVHLLYFFRQENKIRRDLFVNTDDVIRYDDDNKPYINEAFKDVKRFVFIDDLCGSGIQATSDDSNVRRCVGNIRDVVNNAEISYFMLFGLSNGVEYVRNYEFCGKKLYDHVEALIELDGSYSCFSDTSRFFNDGYHDKEIAKNPLKSAISEDFWVRVFITDLAKHSRAAYSIIGRSALRFPGLISRIKCIGFCHPEGQIVRQISDQTHHRQYVQFRRS